MYCIHSFRSRPIELDFTLQYRPNFLAVNAKSDIILRRSIQCKFDLSNHREVLSQYVHQVIKNTDEKSLNLLIESGKLSKFHFNERPMVMEAAIADSSKFYPSLTESM
jgi:hypothetical protein